MSNTLLLIPTETERQLAADHVTSFSADTIVELCGFGPIVAGIRAAQLIDQHRPQKVCLIGIAGALQRQLELGTAREFDQVACYGIGVGYGSSFQSASDIGWPQWSCDSRFAASQIADSQRIADVIDLASTDSQTGANRTQLLTVCAASASVDQVALHHWKFPHAIAEDMEGFAVAAACKLAQVPLRIFRGLSNLAGDRDQRNWQSSLAMRSAVDLALSSLEDRM